MKSNEEAQSETPSVETILASLKCIQCDGSGGIQVGEDDFEQCQFCFEVRQPFIKEATAKINRLITEARIEEIKQLAIEGIKRGGFETINNLQNYLGERLQELSNNLSKGDGK